MLDQKRVSRLYARQTHGIKPGLESTRELLEFFGNPEHNVAAIHVAGTNGKGSVCSLLATGLSQSGLSIGLYTSPHLVRPNERFVVDGEPVSNGELDSLLSEVEDGATAVERQSGVVPTFFECMTVAAFLFFQRRGVKLAILETGMGGRLDATNVITPLLSVITRIAMDHSTYLGNSIAEIAAEKAGIIKPGRPVVIGDMPEEARAVIVSTALQQKAPVIDVVESVSVRRISGNLESQKLSVCGSSRDYGTLPCSLAASYQVENIATAVAAMETFETHLGLPLPDDVVAYALANTKWPGRFELIEKTPPLLVDGAHNPDGAKALLQALKDAKATENIAIICGFCGDKDVEGFFRAIASLPQQVWCVPIRNQRSLSPAEAVKLAQRYRINAEAVETLEQALQKAKSWADESAGTIVVCGSLFLVGELLENCER